MTYAIDLECPRCGAHYPIDKAVNLCGCGSGLLAQFDLQAARKALDRDRIAASGRSIWRFRDLLPIADPDRAVTLGEGGTPLVPVPRLGEKLGIASLYVKDDGINPTGTFKARGASVGVTKARELGIRDLVLASSGNAAYGWATYAARGGMAMHVVMLGDATEINLKGCSLVGADMYLVDGDRGRVGQVVKSASHRLGWFDVSREPYRIEGKKTIAYEVAEQLGWKVPDVLLFPTGGGVGLTSVWKAFRELAQLGWTDGKMPRLVCVQTEGCHPVVKAFREGTPLEEWPNPYGIANGIRNPNPLWGDVILTALRETDGTGIAVSDRQIVEGVKLLAATESILACPEGAATVLAAGQLRQAGFIRPEEVVVLVITGSGLKYPHVVERPQVRRLKADEEIGM